MSPKDCVAPHFIRSIVSGILKNTDSRVKHIHETRVSGTLNVEPGLTLNETKEMNIMHTLNEARHQAGQIISKAVNMNNNKLARMLLSGAKGNNANITQILGFLGQQSLQGSRIKRNKYGDRSFPVVDYNDNSPKGRSFIASSYTTGLDLVEYFTHCFLWNLECIEIIELYIFIYLFPGIINIQV